MALRFNFPGFQVAERIHTLPLHPVLPAMWTFWRSTAGLSFSLTQSSPASATSTPRQETAIVAMTNTGNILRICHLLGVGVSG
jgi:hypothetical protein